MAEVNEPWRDDAVRHAVAMEREDAANDDTLTESDLDEAFSEGWGEAIYQHKQSAIEAINQIRRGEYVEAITTLEREFLPKWSSRADCEAAYKEAMGR